MPIAKWYQYNRVADFDDEYRNWWQEIHLGVPRFLRDT